MTTQEWLAEQKAVWGSGPEFGDAVERLKLADARLIDLAERLPPSSAGGFVSAVLEAMAPVGSLGTGPALVRFQSLRPEITARVRRMLEDRRGGNIAVWVVANAFLRGDTDALEQVLPPGLRALSCEEWAAEEAAQSQS